MDPQPSNPRPGCSSRNTPGVVFSLLLVAAGVVLLLDQMGIAQMGYLFQFWPAGVILFGLAIALQPEVGSRIWGGAVSVGGVILLLRNLGYVHVDFWAIWWPLAMIAFGVSLLWSVTHAKTGAPLMGDWRRHHRRNLRGTPFFNPEYWDSSAVMNEAAVFGGGDRRYSGGIPGSSQAAGSPRFSGDTASI